MLGALQKQAQIIGRTDFYHPVRHFGVAVIVTVLPPFLLVHHQYAVFGDDMSAGNQLYVAECGDAVHYDDISQLYERMPPVDAVQCQVHKGLEPWRLEDGRQVGILIALPVYDAEALVQDVAFALSYAAGEVHVHFHVAVYVV